jgi:hypothetical protein
LHWLVGGNGGTVRQRTGRLYDYQKEGMKAAVRAMGITPREPEEEFYIGRVNYAKGYRLPCYEDRKRRISMQEGLDKPIFIAACEIKEELHETGRD